MLAGKVEQSPLLSSEFSYSIFSFTGDGLNGGAHQCFCSNSYGKYGLDVNNLLQSMYNSFANLSKPDKASKWKIRQPGDGPGR